MSDSRLKRQLIRTSKPDWGEMEEEKEIPTLYRWHYSRECRRTGFVNCRFGETGGCMTPSHQMKEVV